MHGYVACVYHHHFINFTFCDFFFFLTLLCAKQTDFSPHKHTHTQTQTHRQINTETDRRWRRRSVVVGRRSPCFWVLILVVLVGFYSCGSCGGDGCLWWINYLTMRGKGRKRCLWREVIWPWGKEEGGVYSLPWKEEERSRRSQKDKDWSEWEMR